MEEIVTKINIYLSGIRNVIDRRRHSSSPGTQAAEPPEPPVSLAWQTHSPGDRLTTHRSQSLVTAEWIILPALISGKEIREITFNTCFWKFRMKNLTLLLGLLFLSLAVLDTTVKAEDEEETEDVDLDDSDDDG